MKVTANTLLRDPSTGDLVSVAAGEDVPEWAERLIGAHILKAEPEKAEQPDESWTVADLRAYAKHNGVDLDGATAKADILAAIKG